MNGEHYDVSKEISIVMSKSVCEICKTENIKALLGIIHDLFAILTPNVDESGDVTQVC